MSTAWEAEDRAEALDINWRNNILGPESIKVEVVDPRSGGLGVTMAILAERGAPGVVVGAVEGTPVRTEGASVLGCGGGT